MPVTYTIADNLLHLRLAGEYAVSDVTGTFLQALADPECPPNVALLVDVSGSMSIAGRSEHEIRQVATFLRPHTERIGGRCAVMATSEVGYARGVVGSVYSKGIGVDARVFRTLERALEWLGVKP
jgi:hypothetical protein